MVKTNPNSQTEANLLLLRAECFEESGKTNEADEIYVSLNKKFAGTAMGGHAFNRLARLDSDEREHFGIAFASGEWKRVRKRWNGRDFEATFIPAGATEGEAHEIIVVRAEDFRDERPTMEIALGRVKALLERDFERVSLRQIETGSNDTYFEFQLLNAFQIEKEKTLEGTEIRRQMKRGTGVGRVYLSKSRVHIVIYLNIAMKLDENEKKTWLSKLRSAHLADYKCLKSNRTNMIDCA